MYLLFQQLVSGLCTVSPTIMEVEKKAFTTKKSNIDTNDGHI